MTYRNLVTAIAATMLFQIACERVAIAQGAAAVFSPTGPDAAAYGKSLGYPVGLPFKKQQNMVGNYSNADRVRPTRTVKAASPPSPLMRARQELSLTYTFDGKTLTLQDYLDRNPTTGLLIAAMVDACAAPELRLGRHRRTAHLRRSRHRPGAGAYSGTPQADT